MGPSATPRSARRPRYGGSRQFVAILAVAGVAMAAAVPYLPGFPYPQLRADALLDQALGRGAPADPGPAVGSADPTSTWTSTPEPSTGPSAPASADPSASQAPEATLPLLHRAKVEITAVGYWSWALLDLRTGEIVGSGTPTTTSDTASMIKPWIAADYLRRAAEQRRTPSSTVLGQLATMIRDSDNTHAYEFHVANGNLSSIKRMITMCGLTDTRGVQNSWSLTQMSTRDITRLAACVADGRAAGSRWTGWLLEQMRGVRGPGRFGVILALPAAVAATTAIKNGWLLRDDDHLWHISCLAIGDGWALGVHARYRNTLGKDYGATICRRVGEQLMAPGTPT